MNFGRSLRQAHTDWFVWLAADDYWAPQFLEACLAAADGMPEAVSVLPRWTLQGQPDAVAQARHKPTGLGPRHLRLLRFLASPGGTRMYGLIRRAVAQAAFPTRHMHAYDWYFMIGVLNAGPQLDLDGSPLLFRDETPLRHYSEAASKEPFWRRRFPASAMSAAAVRKGWVPLANLTDLLALNLRLHEEYLIHIHPDIYAKRLWLFRRFGFPIARVRAAGIARSLAEEVTPARTGAQRILRRLMDDNDAAAARALADLRANGVLPGDANLAYARARDLGDADAGAILAERRFASGQMVEASYWVALLDAFSQGSDTARKRLEQGCRSDALTPAVNEVVKYRLREHVT